MSPTAPQIAEAALTLVNVPFANQGRDEAVGLDCAGVLVAAFRKLGITLRELPVNYRRLPREAHVRGSLEMNFVATPRRPVQPGDILHLRFLRDREARHLAIVTPGPSELMIVHALKSRGAVVLDTLRGALTETDLVNIYQWPR